MTAGPPPEVPGMVGRPAAAGVTATDAGAEDGDTVVVPPNEGGRGVDRGPTP